VTALTGVTKIADSSISTRLGLTGATSAYAIKADGTVLAWGDNAASQLGLGVDPAGSCAGLQPAQNCVFPTPVALPGLSNITDVSAGIEFAVALKSDGTVWGWGRNPDGELGPPPDRSVPAQLAGLSSVTAISAGWHQVAALTTG
jgi:alpha-tubulin suppressor-like RCC1 family protein